METKDCIVRESVLEDLNGFYELYQSAGMEFIEPLEEYEKEKDKLLSYIENRYPFYGYGMWTVIDKTTRKVIGRMGLEEREIDGVEYTEIGYMLHHLYRRNGIATELCKGILEYAKTTLYIEEIHAFFHEENVVSKHLLEKLQFEFCGKVLDKNRVWWHYRREL